MGGLHESYVAYQTWVQENGEGPVIVPGLTNNQVWIRKVPTLTDLFPVGQLFFVSYALSWCEIDTPEAIKRMVKSNPHSPPQFRVIGPVSQYTGFAQAFNCTAGSPMNPVTKCTVW